MCNKCHNENIDQVELREAIVKAFSMEELRTLCIDVTRDLHCNEINEQVNLDLLDGEGLRGKAQSLIEFFYRRKILSYLIAAVCRVRSYHQHDRFYLKKQTKNTELVVQRDATPLLYHHHFDLEDLVQKFLYIVRGSQGVVGFGISCDYPQFLKIFCERIRDAFRNSHEFKGKVDIKETFTLKYSFTDIDSLIRKIDDIKHKNPNRFISIPIYSKDANEDIIKLFWQKAQERFDFNLMIDHTIIVIMMGSSNCTFPEKITNLRPSFTKDDFQQWLLRVGIILEWPAEHIKAHWKMHILQKCLEDADILDMEFVYNYMDKVKSILQGDTGVSLEDFFYKLEKESTYL